VSERGPDSLADPTLSLLGVPEVARPQATVQALRRAQTTEWLVNAVDAPKSALSPMDTLIPVIYSKDTFIF
jgi:hypothetical protein